MGDDDYDDDDDHDAVIIVPQTELVAIRFWLRYIYTYIYGFLFRSFRSLANPLKLFQLCIPKMHGFGSGCEAMACGQAEGHRGEVGTWATQAMESMEASSDCKTMPWYL